MYQNVHSYWREGLNPKLSTCGGKYRKEMKALAALQSLLLLTLLLHTMYSYCTTLAAAVHQRACSSVLHIELKTKIFFKILFFCLFVSRVGSNLCLMNWIRICRVPRGTNETWGHWNGLCSRSPNCLRVAGNIERKWKPLLPYKVSAFTYYYILCTTLAAVVHQRACSSVLHIELKAKLFFKSYCQASCWFFTQFLKTIFFSLRMFFWIMSLCLVSAQECIVMWTKIFTPIGQVISKAISKLFIWTKNPNKYFCISALALKSDWIKRI